MEKQEKNHDQAFSLSGKERLHQAREKQDEIRFKSLINHFLPSLRNYIGRRLNLAHSTGLLSRNRVIAEDVIDLVYIRLYEEFAQSAGKNLETWVYGITDEVLDQQLNEEAFEREYLVELQQLEDLELSGLEEKFSSDAEGNPVMDEDLDDVSYSGKYYDPVKFIEDNDTLEHLESDFSEFDKKRLHDEIQRQLISLPEEDRSVFDLFWIVGLSMSQISEIRNIPVSRVETILKNVGTFIRKRLSGRK